MALQIHGGVQPSPNVWVCDQQILPLARTTNRFIPALNFTVRRHGKSIRDRESEKFDVLTMDQHVQPTTGYANTRSEGKVSHSWLSVTAKQSWQAVRFGAPKLFAHWSDCLGRQA